MAIFRSRIWVAVLLLALLPLAAQADVWGYVDAKGVAHVASERVDERYTLFARSNADFDSRAMAGAAEAPATMTATTTKLMGFIQAGSNDKAVKRHLQAAAKTHGLDYELLQALIAAESGFDTMAVSTKGAIGLMQVLPATAQRFGLEGDAKTSLDKKLTDPKLNIGIGSRYLRQLLQLFAGKLDLALAAYNAGEGAVQKAGNRIPPFKETQDYVNTVLQLYTLLKPPPAPTRSATRVRSELPARATGRANTVPSAAPNSLEP